VIGGCNTQFKDDLLYGKISPFIYNERALGKNHEQIMSSLKVIESAAQRSLKGLAFLATESVKKCPTLVWMVPAEPSVGRSPQDWIMWAKSAATHRKYHVYFVCQHSFTPVDIDPVIAMEVPRSWMVQAAPVLRLSLFAIKAALSALSPLPFPVPDILPKEQILMNEQFVNSFMGDTTTKSLNAFESACNRGIDLPQTELSKLLTLTGPAYDGIVEKSTKLKRTHWKQYIIPVMNH
jgi:hypothetical protein